MAASKPGLSEAERKEIEERQRLTAMASKDVDGPASAEEAALIAQIRERFADDFARRKAEGRDHSCCFGDMALLRVLRGNDCDLAKSIEWWARFLETYEQEKVEELVLEMTRRLDAAGGIGSNEILPNFDAVKEHTGALFSLPVRAPSGDVVTYIPIINTDKRALVEKEGVFKSYVPFMRGALVLRMIELDRLSREQGRMVKVVSVFDLAGCSLGWLSCAAFDKAFDQEIGKWSEKISAELYSTFHIINAPWFVTKIYNMVKGYLPERLRRKIFFVDGLPQHNADFLRTAGGFAQLQQMVQFRADFAGVAEAPSGTQEVPRRQLFERCLEARPGEAISWSFEVVRGSGDLLMGVSDIDFEVVAFWSADEDAATPAEGSSPAGLEGDRLVETVRISASDGEQRGSYCPSRPGLVVLRWSNVHSRIRAKSVRYSVEAAGSPKQA